MSMSEVMARKDKRESYTYPVILIAMVFSSSKTRYYNFVLFYSLSNSQSSSPFHCSYIHIILLYSPYIFLSILSCPSTMLVLSKPLICLALSMAPSKL